jgi:DNA repair exonuclease SbcCD ATPase subunit
MTTSTDISARVDALARREAELAGSVAALKTSLVESGARITTLAEAIEVADKAKAVLESYAVEQQAELQQSVESLVTRGLQTVFQERIEFKMTFAIVRNQPEVSFAVVSYIDDEPIEMDIPNSFGGGLAVVTAVLLRIIVLRYLVAHGTVEPILVLDEPLAALSPNYEEYHAESLRTRMAEFLRVAADELGIQLIVVTHEPDYGDYADKHYIFSGGLGKDTVVTAGVGRVDE